MTFALIAALAAIKTQDGGLPQAPATPVIPAETKAQKDARMKWWREARFGMFIHWGLYAIPAGTWKGSTGHAEWIRETAQIPRDQYDQLATKFDPVKFNAKTWVSLAKMAGMKYMVITSKHHDGFNMFASKYTDFNIMNTPFKHDPMKDLSAAADSAGLKFCFYHSIMDWNDPNYLPRRSWEAKDRPADGADFQKYVQYLRNDIMQLLTNYGPVGVLWFDGEWENTWKEPYGSELYALCRTLQPNIIVNNRVGHARDTELGDYSTPEQTIPATGLPGVDWETCMTMNDHWGYNKDDFNYKSVETLVRDLVDIASKGGNFLLNVGPTAEGELPPLAIDRLKGIGAWMNVNHDAIYDTTASVFPSLPFGRCTVRAGEKKSQLFLHVFDWPTDGNLVVPSIGNDFISAHILGGRGVAVERNGANLVIKLPAKPANAIDTVVELDVKGMPVVYQAPTFTNTAPGFVSHMDVALSVPTGLQVKYTTDGSEVTDKSMDYLAPIPILASTEVRAAGFYQGKKVTTDVAKTFDQSTLWQALPFIVPGAPNGLFVDEFNGDFNSVDDFINAKPDRQTTANSVQLDPEWKTIPEHIGRVYTSLLEVRQSEMYRFDLTSDDGARLWIDGKLVADDDGTHQSTTVTGYAPLQKGLHEIKVAWFNKTGDAALSLKWGAGDQPVGDVLMSSFIAYQPKK